MPRRCSSCNGGPRSLRTSKYNERRAECDAALDALRALEPGLPHLAAAEPELVRRAGLDDVLRRRALHVTEETRRVRALVEALRGGGRVPGELLVASHASLRDQYECSSPELDCSSSTPSPSPGSAARGSPGQGGAGARSPSATRTRSERRRRAWRASTSGSSV
jgi:galactokinase